MEPSTLERRGTKRPLRPPIGRTISLIDKQENLLHRFQSGLLNVGDAVGLCGPECGDIVVKMSGAQSTFPHRPFAACSAHSSQKHGTFFWLTEEEELKKELKKEATVTIPKVPHCIWKGLCDWCVQEVLCVSPLQMKRAWNYMCCPEQSYNCWVMEWGGVGKSFKCNLHVILFILGFVSPRKMFLSLEWLSRTPWDCTWRFVKYIYI